MKLFVFSVVLLDRPWRDPVQVQEKSAEEVALLVGVSEVYQNVRRSVLSTLEQVLYVRRGTVRYSSSMWVSTFLYRVSKDMVSISCKLQMGTPFNWTNI